MKTSPKYRVAVWAIPFFAFLISALPGYAVEVTSLAAAPVDNVNINTGAGVANGITARYFAAGNQRSLSQTFTWNSDLGMTGVGLLIASTQNTVSGQYFTQSQNYYLDIQELVSATGDRSVVSAGTLTTVEFTLTTSLVAASKYLYVQFDVPLALTNGAGYGFNLRPAEIVDNNSVAIDKTSVAYTGGVGNQTGSVSLIADGGAYGNASLDYVFFTTTASAVPEPATAVSWLGIGVIGFALSRRRR